MNMNRRQALGVIGLFAASPMMLVKPQEKKIIRTDQEIIPTGFPVLDEAMRGGLRPGIHTITGACASGKGVMARSIALHAARTHSVALMPSQDGLYTMRSSSNAIPYEGKLTVFYYPPENTALNLDWWKWVTEKYDLIIDEQFEDRITIGAGNAGLGFKTRIASDWLRLMLPLALENRCCLLTTVRTNSKVNAYGESSAVVGYPFGGIAYFSSDIITMRQQPTACQWTFVARLLKNRYGDRNVEQNLILDVGKHVFVPAPFNWGPMPRQHYQVDQLRDKPDPLAFLKSLG